MTIPPPYTGARWKQNGSSNERTLHHLRIAWNRALERVGTFTAFQQCTVHSCQGCVSVSVVWGSVCVLVFGVDLCRRWRGRFSKASERMPSRWEDVVDVSVLVCVFVRIRATSYELHSTPHTDAAAHPRDVEQSTSMRHPMRHPMRIDRKVDR